VYRRVSGAARERGFDFIKALAQQSMQASRTDGFTVHGGHPHQGEFDRTHGARLNVCSDAIFPHFGNLTRPQCPRYSRPHVRPGHESHS
jgi:hypothetical protein